MVMLLVTTSKTPTGSKVIYHDDIIELESSVTIPANQIARFDFNYPTGLTQSNCVPISFGIKQVTDKGFNYYGYHRDSSSYLNNEYTRSVNLQSSSIQMRIYNDTDSAKSVTFKLVLLKIS